MPQSRHVSCKGFKALRGCIDRHDAPLVTHEFGKVGGFTTWGCAQIEDPLTRLGVEHWSCDAGRCLLQVEQPKPVLEGLGNRKRLSVDTKHI